MKQPRMGYCRCIHFKKGRGYTLNVESQEYVCSDCYKPTDHGIQLFSYECEYCEEVFVKNFSHPAYDYNNPKCWWCLEEHHPDVIGYHYVTPFKKVPPPEPVAEENFAFEFEM